MWRAFFLQLISINETIPGDVPHVIQGDKILSDNSTMAVEYIGRVTDPQAFSPWLRRAIIARITFVLSNNISGADPARWEAYYEKEKTTGLSREGQQGSNQQLIQSDFLDDR